MSESGTEREKSDRERGAKKRAGGGQLLEEYATSQTYSPQPLHHSPRWSTAVGRSGVQESYTLAQWEHEPKGKDTPDAHAVRAE